MDTKQRIEWIDISKGIGMLLVIAGHTIALNYSYPLYSFHMPLFFLLSGLFIKTNVGWKEYLYKCAHQLLWPWFGILLVSAIVCMLIPEWRDGVTLKAIIKDLYSTNTNVFQNSSLWFLICLFVVEIFFFFLDKTKLLFGKYQGVFYTLFIMFSICLLWQNKALTMINMYVPLWGGRLPFKLDTALLCLVFFAIGNWFKEDIKMWIPKVKWYAVVFIIFIWMLLAWWDAGINYNALTFGRAKWLFYPIAFWGIIGTLGLSEIISKSPAKWLKNMLRFYGRNSLIIFGFQSLFIRLYLLMMNHVLGLNMFLYVNNPIEHQIGSFVIVAFVSSPLLAWCYEKMK